MFKFENKRAENTLLVTVGGFFTPEEGENFVKEYTKNVAAVRPSNYKLIVESVELAASSQAQLPALEYCLQMYMKDGFNKIVMVNPKSAISKIQLQKLARNMNFKGDFVNTLPEALAK